MNSTLKSELSRKVLGLNHKQFEKLVIDAIAKIGYGGSLKDVAEHLRKSGNEVIDGLIKHNILGLDKIYLQAKRWKDGNVGRQEIQKFVGTLHGKGAKKYIFFNDFTFYKRRYRIC